MPTEPEPQSVSVQPGWRRYACAFPMDMPEDTVNVKFDEVVETMIAATGSVGVGVGTKRIIQDPTNEFYTCECWLIY